MTDKIPVLFGFRLSRFRGMIKFAALQWHQIWVQATAKTQIRLTNQVETPHTAMRTKLLLLLSVTCFALTNVLAQVVSVQSGDFNVGSTWSGSTTFQNVTVSTGDTVTVPAALTHLADVTVANGGVLLITGFSFTTVSGDIIVDAGGKVLGTGNLTASNGNMYISGDVLTTGSVKISGGVELVVNGTGSVMDASELVAEGQKLEISGTVDNVPLIRTLNADLELSGGADVTVDSVFIAGMDADLFVLSGSPALEVLNGMGINDGRFVHSAGTIDVDKLFSVTRTDSDTASSNTIAGMTVGEFRIRQDAMFDNSNTINVNGSVQILDGSSITNTADFIVGDSMNVDTSSTFTNSGSGAVDITKNLYVQGVVTNSADIDCEDLNNYATVTNSGTIDMSQNLYNNGTLEGAGGTFNVANRSVNWEQGELDGTIDVCDATLAQPTWYLDVDSGTVDFLTVTFCTETIIEGTDIEELDANQVAFFPNPTSGLLNISIGNNNEANLEVLDLVGNLLLSEQVIGNTQINLMNEQNGIYLIKLTSGKDVITRKVIKH